MASTSSVEPTAAELLEASKRDYVRTPAIRARRIDVTAPRLFRLDSSFDDDDRYTAALGAAQRRLGGSSLADSPPPRSPSPPPRPPKSDALRRRQSQIAGRSQIRPKPLPRLSLRVPSPPPSAPLTRSMATSTTSLVTDDLHLELSSSSTRIEPHSTSDHNRAAFVFSPDVENSSSTRTSICRPPLRATLSTNRGLAVAPTAHSFASSSPNSSHDSGLVVGTFNSRDSPDLLVADRDFEDRVKRWERRRTAELSAARLVAASSSAISPGVSAASSHDDSAAISPRVSQPTLIEPRPVSINERNGRVLRWLHLSSSSSPE